MNITNAKSQRRWLYIMVAVGFMAALVYIGNYMQIKIPNGVLVTRVHLGNSMCLLAGLLFGGISGGLASGIGASMFDLFDPVYITSAPYTFISKFAMGFMAGFLCRKFGDKKISVIMAAITGQIVYIILYLIKSFFTVIILGNAVEAAWAATGTNAISSSINAVLAIIISIPLYYAIKKALKHIPMFNIINAGSNNDKKEKLFNPLTTILTLFSIIVTIIFCLHLTTSKKLESVQIEKENALNHRITALEEKYNELYSIVSDKETR